MKANNKKSGKGGFSNSDPRNKDRSFWTNPTALKILCAIASGQKTKKDMITIDSKDKTKKYLPKGTIIYFLSNAKEFSFEIKDKSKEILKSNQNFKLIETPYYNNMVSEEIIFIENQIDNHKIRRTGSRIDYIYEINYEMLAEKFIEYINVQIESIKDEIEKNMILKSMKNINLVIPSQVLRAINPNLKPKKISKKTEKGNVAVIPGDIHAIFELGFNNRLISYSSKLNLIQLNNLENKKMIGDFLHTFLIQYYRSKREDLHIKDVFKMAQNHLKRGENVHFLKNYKIDKEWRLNKNKENSFFSEINNTLNLLDVDFFDLAPEL